MCRLAGVPSLPRDARSTCRRSRWARVSPSPLRA
jgi:hypothetical protein